MRAIQVALLSLLGAVGCKGKDAAPATQGEAAAEKTVSADMSVEEEPAAEEEMAVGDDLAMAGEGRGAPLRARANLDLAEADGMADEEQDASAASEVGPSARAWFPETFLFEPLVVTGEDGRAEVKTRVPDRLTTWRVLALAHSRGGSQAGTVTEFLGTLPAYVELVVPPFLRSGDRVELPVQVMNTTASPLASQLSLQATGAAIEGGSGAVSVGARGSAVRYATVETRQPGKVKLSARLGDADSVVREVEVLPRGEKRVVRRSGTLAAPREVEVKVPAQASLHRVRLEVYPGALSLVRSELTAAPARRGGAADDAFALLLAGEAPELLRSLGDEPDPEALRDVALRAAQRVLQRARVLDVTEAALFAEAALTHPENPVLVRLGERAVADLARLQSPDGTCGGQTGWPVQRLLVATAECARAAAGEQEVGIRAAGAFERHGELVKDPYTAAAILASGAPISEGLAAALREKVLDSIEDVDGGAKAVAVPEGVVRADGAVPSKAEATALAVLALQDAPDAVDAPLADLGATLLSAYSPSRGWGDGRANLSCLRAAVVLFRDPIPEKVTVRLTASGEELARGELDRDRVREVLVLEAEPELASGPNELRIESDPPLPGLGYALSIASWVPWKAKRRGGVELRVKPPENMKVGRASEVQITAAAPSGMPITIELALPAGVQADESALERLVSQKTIASFELGERALVLTARDLPPGRALSARVRVIPTLAGTLWSGPARMKVGGDAIHVPPTLWTIRR